MRDKNEIFCFRRGAFFAGDLEYRIVHEEQKFILRGRTGNDFCWMESAKFEIPEKEIVRLRRLLKPVLKWEKSYENEAMIMDGYDWAVYFCYNGCLIETDGYEKYPRDYERVKRKLQLFIEKLGAKYNDNYQVKGIKDRIEL